MNKEEKIEVNIKPMTVNKAWQGRRFKTPEYNGYTSHILWALKKHKFRFKGEIEVEYRFYLKHYKTTDVGNLEKPLSDIIVKSGIIEDDRFIKKITLEKFKGSDYIEIIIKQIENEKEA